jgi:acyl-CoA synthetase (AMP-forming)/AMP-acid ligase II/acyl carrier protein
MTRFFPFMLWSLARWILRLRYRVRVDGLEKLGGVSGPTLVMPNHPGYVDPLLVLSHLRLKRAIRPVVTQSIYRIPLLYPLMRLVQALEVPDLTEQSHAARQRTLAMIDAVVAGLENGESFLIYPAGHVARGGIEVIGAARAVSEILGRFPRANVVLVRTRGIWGSSFSYAQTGERPHLGRCVFRGLGWAVASLLFFMPRRRVAMTVEVAGGSLPAGRDALNRYLEEWYNRGDPQPPTFVPYHPFLGPRRFQYPDLTTAQQHDENAIRRATQDAVNELIEEHLGRKLSDDEKQPQTTLDQIGLDSLDRMDIALTIEDRFGFRFDRVADTLGEVWALAEGLASDGGEAVAPAPAAWERPPCNTGPATVLAETLAEALVRRALAHPGDIAAADQVSGVLSYRKFMVAARLLAQGFAKLPGETVGVMLPASVAADLTFFGLHLAGKLPVMLNWTTGPANVAHAVKQLAVQRVVTSRKLIDRLGLEAPGADYVFLEDLRAQMGKLRAMKMLLASYLLPGSFLRNVPKPDADDTAVVLFTSGSESTPKAVPLSHRNLIVNARGALAAIQATPADRLLGFLPPFHSFGLTGNIIAPILAGLRVIHYPDPTNARALVETVARYQATIPVATPTFLGYMLGVATSEQLRSLRVIVTGAEKCPDALFAKAAQLAPGAVILEGYGITECSPVVAANRIGHIKLGTVGLPLEGVELCVVEPESRQPLPPGATGMLLVRGPSVFRGYLAYEGPDPFADVGGKRWYVTGDLVRLDEEGFIHFQGRLKRFLKAGGEMISLPALEEPLSRLYPPTEEGPRVAVEGIETPSGRWIVLFTTRDISLREANAALVEAGFRGVMRLDEVVRLDAIPVLGTGKTDYKVLRKIVVKPS